MFDIILTGKCKHIEDKDSQVKHTNELSCNEKDKLLENISISLFKERVHIEMKISDKIKLDPNIMPFAFFYSKAFLFLPTSILAPKYHLRDLHYNFQGPALSLPGT